VLVIEWRNLHIAAGNGCLRNAEGRAQRAKEAFIVSADGFRVARKTSKRYLKRNHLYDRRLAVVTPVFIVLPALLRLIARLPLRWLHRIGVVVGWVTYWTWPTHGRRLRENLRASAICAGETEYRALLHETIRETGKASVEVAKVWFGRDREINRLVVECEGWSDVEAARKLGKGIIFITPHLGCFEIAGQYIAQRMPLTVLYQPPRQKWVKSLIIAGRSREQLRLAPTNRRGVQSLLKTLHSGEAIALLPDQAPKSRAGVWADFFGRPAYTMSLVRKLQQSTDASLISIFSKRLPCGTGFRLEFEPVASENFDESTLNRLVEKLVRRCPEQYMWSYNRHKVPRLASQQPAQN
jgi:Kdo2-lipid IVA lauroyltransferase/acyltransferase